MSLWSTQPPVRRHLFLKGDHCAVRLNRPQHDQVASVGKVSQVVHLVSRIGFVAERRQRMRPLHDLAPVPGDQHASLLPQHDCPISRPPDEGPDARGG